MTLYPQDARDVGHIPSDTARVARAAVAEGKVSMRMRDEVGVLFTDETCAPLFSTRGAPLKPPGGWPSCRSCSIWPP